MTNYYEMLEVSPGASQEEIKKAYRRLALKHHPDKGGSEEEFKKVGESYKVLSNQIEREKYDRKRQNHENRQQSKSSQGNTANLERIRKETISKVKQEFNPGGGKLALVENDLKNSPFYFRGCNCNSYRNYEEHIKNHLTTITEINCYAKKACEEIEKVRFFKQKKNKKKKLFEQSLSVFFEKNTIKKIYEITKTELVDSLIKEADSLLENEFCVEGQKRTIEIIKENLNEKKKTLEKSGNNNEKDKTALNNQIQQLKKELAQQKDKNFILKKNMTEKEAIILSRRQEIDSKKRIINEKNANIGKQQRTISDLKTEKAELKSSLKNLQAELAQEKRTKQEIKQELDQLRTELNQKQFSINLSDSRLELESKIEMSPKN